MTRPLGPLGLFGALSQNPSEGQVSVSVPITVLREMFDIDELKASIQDNTNDIELNCSAIKENDGKISTLSHNVDDRYNKLDERINNLEQKWDCVIQLIHATHYLYQYWDYFMAFKNACACETYSDISVMNATKAHKTFVEYNRVENCFQEPVKKQAVNQCIEIAKILASMPK